MLAPASFRINNGAGETSSVPPYPPSRLLDTLHRSLWRGPFLPLHPSLFQLAAAK